jgi:signal transduction histidine kinase
MDDLKTPDRKEATTDVDLLEELSLVNNELTNMHRELGKMNAELHHLNIALQEKNAEMVHFAYAVSHDLRSPLVTIMTFLDHLTKDMALNDAERVEKDIAYSSSAASKMKALLEELLNFSRIGRITNPSVEVPLQDIVREALNSGAGRIDKRGVRVQVTEQHVMLYGDRVWLVEVFQNLIDNAVKFMGDQREPLVEIGIEKMHGEPVFFVRDNGIGIEPRNTAKIFGLFEKIDGAMEGTGIGLALVKRIMEVHGGIIWAESEGPGQGACFRFTLPGKHGEVGVKKF